MAVKLHRCGNLWAKIGSHPCWRAQKALDEQGIAYEVVPGPWPWRKNRREAHGEVRLDLSVRGAIAQLGERLDRTQEVGGSSPPSSTSR